MILSREQIESEAQSGHADDYLIATARAYHDLRDAVRGLHFRDARGGCATCIDPDGFSVWWPCETADVVARVERDNSA